MCTYLRYTPDYARNTVRNPLVRRVSSFFHNAFVFNYIVLLLCQKR